MTLVVMEWVLVKGCFFWQIAESFREKKNTNSQFSWLCFAFLMGNLRGEKRVVSTKVTVSQPDLFVPEASVILYICCSKWILFLPPLLPPLIAWNYTWWVFWITLVKSACQSLLNFEVWLLAVCNFSFLWLLSYHKGKNYWLQVLGFLRVLW